MFPTYAYFFVCLPRFPKFDKVLSSILLTSGLHTVHVHTHINMYIYAGRYYKIIATSMLSAPSVQSGARRYTERYAPHGIMEPIGPPREMRVPHRIGPIPLPPCGASSARDNAITSFTT